MRPGVARAWIEERTNILQIGQCIQFEGMLFREAYPFGYPYNEYESTEEAFLQTKCGSAWGCWQLWYNFENDSYTVVRSEGGNKLLHVSSDRKWMFDRQPDGSYELKEWLRKEMEKRHEESNHTAG